MSNTGEGFNKGGGGGSANLKNTLMDMSQGVDDEQLSRGGGDFANDENSSP
jgi:hypothetical protein